MSVPTRRLVFPAFGLALVATLAWQGRRLVGGTAGTNSATRGASSAVLPQGEERSSVRVHAEGRLVTYPGGEVTVGSEVVGRIVRLAVHEKDAVRHGAVIAQLDDTDLRAAYEEAQARVSEAEADLALYDSDFARLKTLAANSVVSHQALDRTRHDRDAALARRGVAQASVSRLDAAIAKTRITAPISGVVVMRYMNEGETVAAGSPIARIADLRRMRVEADVDEFDAQRLSLGDPVTITTEGSDALLHGHIEEIPDAVVARRLNREDPSRPTDVRVLVAKIALEKPTTLKLGQRVEVEILPQAKHAP